MPIASVVMGKCKKINNMEIRQIIDSTFIDLKKSGKGYLMIRELSCFNNASPDEIRKIKFTLFRSKYFKPHTTESISFSETGIEVASKFDTIEQYEKSLKKPDYFKIISIIATIIMVFLGILNYTNNNENKELKITNSNQTKSIDSLKTVTDSLSGKLLRLSEKNRNRFKTVLVP